MFQRAEAWELVPPGRNSCRWLRRYKRQSCERFLLPQEYRRLGRAVNEAEADGSVWPSAIAAIRLLRWLRLFVQPGGGFKVYSG